MQPHYAVSSFVESQIARWRRQGSVPDMESYIYSADFRPLPEAGSLSLVNATDADQGFVCFYLTYRAIVTTAVLGTGTNSHAAKILLQVTRSDGYALQDRPTSLQNVAGVGIRPRRFYVPFIVGPKMSWETTCSNLDVDNKWDVQVCFHGAKYRLRPRGR